MRFVYRVLLVFCLSAFGCSASESGPEQLFGQLMAQLKSEKAGSALQDFFTGTLLASRKPTEIRILDSQARPAWEVYGPPMEYEVVNRRQIGQKLFELTVVSWHKDEVPLFWKATFVKRMGKWEPLSIFFNDDMAKVGL